MKFAFFEIRPCIEFTAPGGDSHVDSYVTEADWRTAVEEAEANHELIMKFWTVYGRYEDGAGIMLAEAIADRATKELAVELRDAMTAPLSKALRLIEGADTEADNGAVITGPEQAADFIRHFIGASAGPA